LAALARVAGVITVRAVGVDDWATWRELRLAALADAPHAFTSNIDECGTPPSNAGAPG
jgi:hypothetical protein